MTGSVAGAWIDALGIGDLARLNAVLSEDVVLQDSAGRRLRGRAQVSDWLSESWAPPGMTLHVHARQELDRILVAEIELRTPLDAVRTRSEWVHIAVTTDARTVRRIVVDQ